MLGAEFVGGGQVGPKFWENPRSAGAFCRDFTEKKSPQCRAYTRALQMEKSISPLFPGPKGAVVANDWCIIVIVFTIKLNAFHVLQPSQIIMFSPFCPLIIYAGNKVMV